MNSRQLVILEIFSDFWVFLRNFMIIMIYPKNLLFAGELQLKNCLFQCVRHVKDIKIDWKYSELEIQNSRYELWKIYYKSRAYESNLLQTTSDRQMTSFITKIASSRANFIYDIQDLEVGARRYKPPKMEKKTKEMDPHCHVASPEHDMWH